MHNTEAERLEKLHQNWIKQQRERSAEERLRRMLVEYPSWMQDKLLAVTKAGEPKGQKGA